jgi:nucleoside-diphosphate-sugar epimerase
MRIVITGATGNVGTSTIQSLAADSKITSILGLARRAPDWQVDKTEWAEADITRTDLVPLFSGADAVVHLAWLFQPTHDSTVTWRANVFGSARVFKAAAQAKVPALIHASSVGAYSPGPKDRAVDENWQTHGWPTAAYSREKSYVERLLDTFQGDHPECRVVRLRPGFIFKREASSEQRRLFGGPLIPGSLVRPGLIPVVPDIPGLRFQTLHSADAGAAFHQAVVRDVRGPYNLAADPVIGIDELAGLLHARKVRVPAVAARTLLAAGWAAHLVPASPQLFDLALRVPIMDTSKARDELGWDPAHDSLDALREFIEGLHHDTGLDTPPLSDSAGGPFRIRELISGVGKKP